jgi:Rne/Rng family ribonuclease
MAKEICISSTPHETRLAILEDDQLAEIYYERENEYTLAGSIYNGRVSRVLPGMQSAFVDLGLERDAFLYVTDFLELEDSEDSDEIEKAAATPVIREVRAGQGGDRRPREQRQPLTEPESGGPEPQRDLGREPSRDIARGTGRDRRATIEAGTDVAHAGAAELDIPTPPGRLETTESDADEAGAKRWRGRRRRRGGRSTTGPVADPVETEASAETYMEPSAVDEPNYAADIQAAAASAEAQVQTPRASRSERPEHPDRTPVPFVLPGESLSKYGGEPAPETPKAAPPARPAGTFKPATLIESPIEWDGSGLLPGESLSRHRQRQPQPSGVQGEPQGVFADAIQPGESDEDTVEFTEQASAESVHEQGTFSAHEPLPPVVEVNTEAVVTEEQPQEQLPGASAKPGVVEPAHTHLAADPFGSDPSFTETFGYAQEEHSGERQSGHSDEGPFAMNPVEPVIHAPSADEVIAEGTHVLATDPDKPEPTETAQPESDRDASHHVDPLPPSEFRLFGLGGRKKKSDEPSDPGAPHESPAAAASPVSEVSTIRTVSAFAPGTGLVEEEVIEGEEIDTPRHHGRSDEHDLDEYEEEEKLQTQIRSGELGEMLQEAHIDHRIQLNFDEKNGDVDGEDVFDIDEEEEEGEAEGQPANGAHPDNAPQRRERGGRGRRGARGGDRSQGNRRGGPSRRSAQTSDLPIISDLLKPGQEILVQIAKEPIAKKGARITSHIALPGRFLVFMPTVTHVGVSRKIASDEERQRLKRILTSERGEAPGGFIVRTAAEGASEEELRSDLRFLIHLWDEIKQRSENSKSPALIYHDLSLIERILRDQISANFSSIWVDSEADYERIVRFLNRFAPNLVRRVKLYTKETPLFEHFGIQDEISKALRSKVWLKSGGSIVINQTEALVAIDINTGKYVGKTARLEDTIVKTNLDAIPEIVRQIRLRDLGGIIIIDFIDMDERKNRFKVMAALEEALKNDRAPTKVLQFNDFGLVAITRKRVKQSLERTLSVPCPTCQATGMVKSPATVCNEIYIELRKMRKHFENADVLLRVNPETVKTLKANNARWLTEFEDLIGKNILVKSDATLHPEQFDIQG